MDDTAYQAIKAFKERIEVLYGARLEQVILFGSHARGEATEGSDIDLVVVLEGPVRPFEEIDRMADVAWDVDMEHGVLLGVVPVSVEDFESRQSPLLINVRREGVPA